MPAWAGEGIVTESASPTYVEHASLEDFDPEGGNILLAPTTHYKENWFSNMEAGRLKIGARYSFGVWESFGCQASPILRTFFGGPKIDK